jgi:fatty-acyl-CoA synthase
MHIASLLGRAERLWPDCSAVVCGDRRITYAGLARRVRSGAGALVRAGIVPGDRVAIVHPNCHVFVEAYFAAARVGAILTPLNTRLAGREIASILEDSGACMLWADGGLRAQVLDALDRGVPALQRIVWTHTDELPSTAVPSQTYDTFMSGADVDLPPLPPGDDAVAHLYYTSGTTGRAKGVMLTHTNVVSHAWGTIAELQLSDADTWAHVAPMFHLADAWATFAITAVGGRHVIVPRFDPAAVLETFRGDEVTLTNLVPTMLNELVHTPGAGDVPYPSLRMILSGGAPIAPQLVRRIMETFGCEYVQTYGMTETSPYLTLSLLKDHLKGLPPDRRFEYQSRTGREFITVDLRVVDDSGADVPRDDESVGEIWVRGDSVTPGYWNRPDETAEAFRDGWLRTGDLAVIDAEGYVNIVDRRKDMIVTGGENVYSTEVEYVLAEHPAVLECAVIGVPDDRWGEAVHAVVALHRGHRATRDDLINFCKERLARYKAPKAVDLVDELPRTGSGKIFKKGLKERMTPPPLMVSHVDWEDWTPQIPATLMFVVRDGEVLLIRKKRGIGAGKINGPGGKLDPGETLLECAVRETEEELGVRAIGAREMGRLWFQFVDGLTIHCTVFRADDCDGVAHETDEAIPLWTAVDALPFDEMWDDDRIWLPRLLAGQTFRMWATFDGDRMLDHRMVLED